MKANCNPHSSLTKSMNVCVASDLKQILWMAAHEHLKKRIRQKSRELAPLFFALFFYAENKVVSMHYIILHSAAKFLLLLHYEILGMAAHRQLLKKEE